MKDNISFEQIYFRLDYLRRAIEAMEDSGKPFPASPYQCKQSTIARAYSAVGSMIEELLGINCHAVVVHQHFRKASFCADHPDKAGYTSCLSDACGKRGYLDETL